MAFQSTFSNTVRKPVKKTYLGIDIEMTQKSAQYLHVVQYMYT